ncbi:actin-binding proteins ADF family protein [Abortiporus biennis]
MSATSGITVSEELSTTFGNAINSPNVRFLKISIRNESLVPDTTVNATGSLEDDLNNLTNFLEDNVPAYVLVKLDGPSSEWLAIHYVPDTAKVRDKMLYAASRNNLTKSLGAAHFADTIFATSKDDVTADAYRKHKAHLAAPKPMSAREKELEAVKVAEREAGGTFYEGRAARKNHIGTHVGFQWDEDVQAAIKELSEGDGNRIVLASVDPSTETLKLHSSAECDANKVGSTLPASDPVYAFFAWAHSITSPPRRDIVFIYSCPSGSPVRHRMLYSSAFISTFNFAKSLLDGHSMSLLSRKIETSDPAEINEAYLISELAPSLSGSGSSGTNTPAAAEEKKAFARPRPARRHT